MTFLEIQQAVYAATGYESSPPTAVVTRTKAWINEGYRHLHRMPGMVDLRNFSFEFLSVVDQDDYALAQSMERIDAIVNQTHQSRLGNMTRDEYRRLDPAQLTGGTPTHWIPYGLSPVSKQPGSTGLWVASSEAGDTTQTVRVQGIDGTGQTRSDATGTLNGVTRVALGSVTNYIQVLKFNLSATAVGTVTLYDAAAAGNAISIILIGDKSVSYQIIRLWPTASSTDTFVVDGQVTLADLSADTDVPLLPTIYHDLLVSYARMREYERNGRTDGYTIAQADFQDGAAKMRGEVNFPPDYRPVAGVGAYNKQSGWNGLTGWFPAD